MNQWASRNPELAEQGLDYLDAHSDQADWWDKTDDAVRRPPHPADFYPAIHADERSLRQYEQMVNDRDPFEERPEDG